MGYQTFEFLVFTAVVVFLYYALGKKLQKWVLLAANIVFYALAGLEYIPFLATTMLVSFFCARIISSQYKKAEADMKNCSDAAEKKEIRNRSRKKAKSSMRWGLAIVLCILIVDKYTNFAVNNVNAVLRQFGVKPLEFFDFVVPLGISYYTFMAVSYVLDVYWKRYEAEQSLLSYAVYLSFFPHITQGPIGRYNRMMPQMDGGVKYCGKNIVYGSQLMLLGFFKKLVVADRLALLVNKVYGSYQEYTGLIFAVATVFYAVQIYCDFSGCMDIVGGVAEMLGVKLEKNFDHPFFAKTIPEFWRRWHITMGEWFKDYIFYPLSTSSFMKKTKKKMKAKGWNKAERIFTSCFPILVVWCVTGIWHNASWNYFLWGMYFAVIMILSTVFANVNAHLPARIGINTDRFSWRLFQMVRTFVICCIGRVLPRASNVTAAFEIYKRTFQNATFEIFFNGDIFRYGLDNQNMTIALLGIAVVWIVDLLQEKMVIRDELAKQGLPFRWGISIIAILAILILGIYGPGYDAVAFIYGRY